MKINLLNSKTHHKIFNKFSISKLIFSCKITIALLVFIITLKIIASVAQGSSMIINLLDDWLKGIDIITIIILLVLVILINRILSNKGVVKE
ncbi:MAG: hypothetical protein V1838_05970, partial [Patescibacteria group bacterium]